MKKIIYILIIFFISFNVFSEEIIRSGVVPLTKEDFMKTSSNNCKSFSKVLTDDKTEWKHVIPLKLSEESLNNFVAGYNLQEKLVADIVTIWPSYQGRRDEYYILIGNNNCFVKWLELLPNSIEEIIKQGVKAKI